MNVRAMDGWARLDGQQEGAPATEAVQVVPLSERWLDPLMAIELAAYPFPWSRGNFIDSLAARYPMYGLVDGHDRLLAYMVAMHGVDEVHLLNITVDPALQGRGLARRLLRHLYELASASGASYVWLEVRESNQRARDLYEREGFKAVGLRRNYYPAPDNRREHAVVMRRELSAADTP